MVKRINMYKRYYGIYIPNGVYIIDGLSSTAKLVYGRLLRYAGKNGYAYPKQETIAKELNMHISTIKTIIKELKDFGLIEVIRGNTLRHESNRYYFLEHPCLDDSFYSDMVGKELSTENTTSENCEKTTSNIKESHNIKENTLSKDNVCDSNESLVQIEEILNQWFSQTGRKHSSPNIKGKVSKYISNLLSGNYLFTNKGGKLPKYLQDIFTKYNIPPHIQTKKWGIQEIHDTIKLHQSTTENNLDNFFFHRLLNGVSVSTFYKLYMGKNLLSQPLSPVQSKIIETLQAILAQNNSQELTEIDSNSLKLLFNSNYKVDEKKALKTLKKYLSSEAANTKYAPKLKTVEDIFTKWDKLLAWENRLDNNGDSCDIGSFDVDSMDRVLDFKVGKLRG